MSSTKKGDGRSRAALAIAMGAGLAAAAGGAAAYAARRRIRAERTAPDELAGDAVWFDLDAIGVEHHRFPSHDGGELHVVEKGPKDARPILLLHGITEQARVWGYQFRDLSDGYRVLAADLRGHGASRPGTDGYGLDLLARDLATVLETLDLRDAVVVGHSMGGMATMRFAGDHRAVLDERVAGLVFLATAPIVPFPAAVARALRRVAPRLSAFGERRGWDRVPSYRFSENDLSYAMARRAFGRNAVPLHVNLTRECVAEAMAAAAVLPSGIGLVAHNADEALRATHTPSMVIGGELDNILPVAMSRRIADLLPMCELHILEDAGHQLQLERPKEVADLIDRFADRLPAVATA